jgi:hypothetical protein
MFRLLAATNEAPLITAPQTDSSACDCRLKSLDTRTCRLANETMVARHFAPGYHHSDRMALRVTLTFEAVTQFIKWWSLSLALHGAEVWLDERAEFC